MNKIILNLHRKVRQGFEGYEMSKKRKKEIVLTCLGASAEQVTGSCWKIDFPRYNGEMGSIIIECGLNQDGFTTLEQYNANERMLNGIGKEVVENCEYLLIGHSHVLTTKLTI